MTIISLFNIKLKFIVKDLSGLIKKSTTNWNHTYKIITCTLQKHFVTLKT